MEGSLLAWTMYTLPQTLPEIHSFSYTNRARLSLVFSVDIHAIKYWILSQKYS